MLFSVNLQNRLRRRVFLTAACLIVGFLSRAVVGEFIVGTLSDNRTATNRQLINSAIEYFPSSPQLFAKLAQLEAEEFDFKNAGKHLGQAINLSPNNFKYRLLLAEIKDSGGDGGGAEQAFQDALKLAPNFAEVHWNFANFLIRRDRIEESVEHFRRAADANPALVAVTLDLVWKVSVGNVSYLKSIIGENQKSQLKLALLLANQARSREAAEIFSGIDREILLPAWETAAFFDALIKKGFPKLASDLQFQTHTGKIWISENSSLWNGDFENETNPNLPQFDWLIRQNDFARIGCDDSQTHSGRNSLRLEFLGRDTTRLDNEIKHFIALSAGRNYRLDFYVKTAEFKSSEPLRVVVADKSGGKIAESEAVVEGDHDWKKISVRFSAPPNTTDDGALLFVSIRRQPRYSFDAPTSGRVWFDDFAVNEVREK